MTINKGPITQGTDYNYFNKIVVTNTTFGTDADGYAADVFFRFRGGTKNFSLVNEGSIVIEYSFNGNTLHGDLTPGGPTAALFFDNRPVSKIWFRVPSGSSVIRVEAWAAP